MHIIRGSSAVEQLAVNQLVAGSNPAPGAILLTIMKEGPVMGLFGIIMI